MTLSTEQGFPFWLAYGNYPAGLGTGRAGTGRRGDYADTPGAGCLSGYGSRDMAGRISLPYWPRRMGKRDRPKKGLRVLAEALAFVDKTGERFYEAELYRLKGELTLQQFKVSSLRVQVTNPQPLTLTPKKRSRSVFSQGYRHCPAAAGEVMGIARNN